MARSILSLVFLMCNIFLFAQNNDIQKVVASNRGYGHFFGDAVAIHADYAICGAQNEGTQEGAAYIFERDSKGEFSEQQMLKASDPYAGAWFGYAVAIFDKTAVVGAPLEAYDEVGTGYKTEAGAIYIYTRDDFGNWSQLQKLVPNDRDYLAHFGYSVAISDQFVLVGARGEKKDENGLNSIQGAGAAYILEKEDGQWVITQKIVASDRDEDDWFGEDVAIYGTTAVIGVPWEDEDESGENTLNKSGSVYVYDFNSGDGLWYQSRKIVAEDRESLDQFGFSVDIYEDQLAIGCNFKDKPGTENIIDAGAVYMYQLDGSGTWQPLNKLYSDDAYYFDEFGYSVSLHAGHLLVGAYSSDDYGQGTQEIYNAGAAYYFKKSGDTWTQINKIVAPIRSEADNFGIEVGIGADGAGVIGAMREDEDENEENTINDAGAAYFWKSGTSGVGLNEFPGKVEVFPNPVKNSFSVLLDHSENIEINLCNSRGSLIKSESYLNSRNIIIDLHTETPGIYFVEIQSDKYRTVKKIVKR